MATASGPDVFQLGSPRGVSVDRRRQKVGSGPSERSAGFGYLHSIWTNQPTKAILEYSVSLQGLGKVPLNAEFFYGVIGLPFY